MFTTTERETFARHGLIKREKFLPAEKVDAARQVIFQHLAQAGLWRDGSWTLDQEQLTTDLMAGMALVKPLNHHPAILALANDEAPTAASTLVGGRPLFPMSPHPGLLFTLPNATTWTLPHQNWHLDMPRLPDGGVPGVQIFAFLETVEPEGGGTLAVTGSHRVGNTRARINSGDLRKQLKREPYFAALMADSTGDRLHFLHKVGRVGNVELQVVEMTGAPGDVYFMDLRLLHTIAPNARPIPRLMLTQRYLLEAARIALYGK